MEGGFYLLGLLFGRFLFGLGVGGVMMLWWGVLIFGVFLFMLVICGGLIGGIDEGICLFELVKVLCLG